MSELYLGLMSGTSMDGVDAVLAAFRSGRFLGVRASHSAAYPRALRRHLLHVARHRPPLTPAQLCDLDQAVARAFGAAATALLKRARIAPHRVRAIGSHGQTIFHAPAAHQTLQLGDPSLIAARTGITTVADFRRKDLALGGQGAPLVPAFHHAVFAGAREARCVVNIGGIANITVLPPAGRVHGFDTGPGNGLLDEWIAHHRSRAYDRDGAWAATARVHDGLLEALLSDPYFRRRPPKSTGRDAFHGGWVARRFPGLRRLEPATVQRTLLELTARSIADAILRHARPSRRVLVCGGGAHNRVLMARLRALLAPRTVESTANHGLDPLHVEGAAFAWLACRTLHGLPGNLPAVTGAKAPTILGGIYRA